MVAMLQPTPSELGFGFRSIGRLAKRSFNVAAMPIRAAARVANVTAASLCKDGKSVAGDSQSSSFCRAMKLKDSVTARKYLPAAVQRAAARAATARQIYSQAKTAATQPGLSASDVQLLSSLEGADSNDLAFALAGVDPNGLGAFTTSDALATAPFAIAVAAGFWMLTRG
jgi:hypothetical protein